MIYESISQLVGRTPMLQLTRYCTENALPSQIFAKLEGFNPAGSVKDRVALSMLNDAEKRGVLRPDSVIIEPTSGNTGIGLAAIGVSRGYRVILTMPETMSLERRRLLAAYGAELILTDGALGMKGAIAKANELLKEIPNSFMAGQFDNPANPEAHYRTTGPEIWSDLSSLDFFVAGIGTGGTISGIGRYLKEQDASIRVVGIEPSRSPVLTEGISGPHGLQGIGAGFVPKTLDLSVVDEIATVSEADAFRTGRAFAKAEGILLGISSAAALHAASELAKLHPGKRIAVLFPDCGDRYLSTEGYL